MRITKLDYSIETLSLDIYISGCKEPHCEGCHNPELWDFSVGELYTQDYCDNIIKKIKEHPLLIDRILIMGGEPLDQDNIKLRHLLRSLSLNTEPDIYLFTRYELKDIQPNISIYTDFIKCSKYSIKEKTDNNIQFRIKLASMNQTIYRKGVDY